MKNKKESTDFFNFGTFKNTDADILKRELEMQGVPVKSLYPGTNIGKDATAGASFTAYTLMIRFCDFQLAEKIMAKFNITSIKKGEPMPLPKIYEWTKADALVQFSAIGLAVCFIGVAILSSMSNAVEKHPFLNWIPIGCGIFFLLLPVAIFVRFLKEKFKKK